MRNSQGITKGWPPKRRKEQAERIRKAKIWQKSTGPKTETGKIRCKYNALKHGRFCAHHKNLRKALRLYRQRFQEYSELVKQPDMHVIARKSRRSKAKADDAAIHNRPLHCHPLNLRQQIVRGSTNKPHLSLDSPIIFANKNSGKDNCEYKGV